MGRSLCCGAKCFRHQKDYSFFLTLLLWRAAVSNTSLLFSENELPGQRSWYQETLLSSVLRPVLNSILSEFLISKSCCFTKHYPKRFPEIFKIYQVLRFCMVTSSVKSSFFFNYIQSHQTEDEIKSHDLWKARISPIVEECWPHVEPKDSWCSSKRSWGQQSNSLAHKISSCHKAAFYGSPNVLSQHLRPMAEVLHYMELVCCFHAAFHNTFFYSIRSEVLSKSFIKLILCRRLE